MRSLVLALALVVAAIALVHADNAGFIQGQLAMPSGSVQYYNGVPTAGVGLPAIVAYGRVTGKTSGQNSIAVFTVGANDGTFLVSGNVNCTSYSSGNINIQVTYTDETNASDTVSLQGHFTSGYTVNVSGTGAFECQPVQIRAKAGTSITVKTAGTFTATYNAEGAIRWLD